ncbi:MAG TPA: hypothetical protein VF471_16975 [Pseudoxanthomonas sp.]
MNDYIFLMYESAQSASASTDSDWGVYLERLDESGHFGGGSAIGEGLCASKSEASASITAELSGYIRVTANSIEEARALLSGNPTYEAGGRVEIRELPRTG